MNSIAKVGKGQNCSQMEMGMGNSMELTHVQLVSSAKNRKSHHVIAIKVFRLLRGKVLTLEYKTQEGG